MVIQMIKCLSGYLWEMLKQWTEKKLIEENRWLKETFKLKGNMVCEHSAYWIKGKQGEITYGPFCTNCFDNAQATRRLIGGCKPKDQGRLLWKWVQYPESKVPFRQRQVGLCLNTR